MSKPEQSTDLPMPGSRAALDAGCSCPVLDNHHGKGRGGDGSKFGWYYSGACTLHAAAPRRAK